MPWIGVVIAVLALLVSAYTAYLLRRDFIATHRPYVCATDRQTVKDGKSTIDVDTVLVRCFNAPAQLLNGEVSYVVVKPPGGAEEGIGKTPIKSQVVYPAKVSETQITEPNDFVKRNLEKYPTAQLRRKIRIEYKGLSIDRKYYFEASWDFRRDWHVWETTTMTAN